MTAYVCVGVKGSLFRDGASGVCCRECANKTLIF